MLGALPPDERGALEPLLERTDYARGRVLYDPERPIEHVHFVEEGIISVLSLMRDGSAIETATIGRDGLIGLPVFHGVSMVPEQAMVQVSGWGYRMEADAFRARVGAMPVLRELLHRFSVAMFTFAAQNSGCNRKHTVEQRCARWLLTVGDRMSTREFDLTHEFVSQMLGVRRATVTETLGALEQRGLIGVGRARIALRDREGLQRAACECYDIIQSAIARVYGEPAVNPLTGRTFSEGGQSLAGDGTPAPGAPGA